MAFVPPAESADVVPQALALRLGRLWCNPCMDALIPGWRDCIAPYLPSIASSCAEAGRLAKEAEKALQHAQTLTEDSRAVLDGSKPLTAWLPHVPAAVSAIAFGPHKDLVKLVLLVLASAAGSADSACGANIDSSVGQAHHALHISEDRPAAETAQLDLNDSVSKGASILLTLLQHNVQSVQSRVWAAVQELLHQGSEGSSHASGLLRLLRSQLVMRHIVVDCVARDEHHDGVVVDALQCMLASNDNDTVKGTMPNYIMISSNTHHKFTTFPVSWHNCL
jgi:hypothetical protein